MLEGFQRFISAAIDYTESKMHLSAPDPSNAISIFGPCGGSVEPIFKIDCQDSELSVVDTVKSCGVGKYTQRMSYFTC